jgi:hypothetical protein
VESRSLDVLERNVRAIIRNSDPSPTANFKYPRFSILAYIQFCHQWYSFGFMYPRFSICVNTGNLWHRKNVSVVIAIINAKVILTEFNFQ